jgi:hypothetical protein
MFLESAKFLASGLGVSHLCQLLVVLRRAVSRAVVFLHSIAIRDGRSPCEQHEAAESIMRSGGFTYVQ